MKKNLLFLLLFFFQFVSAQFSTIGSEKYGRILFLNYAPTQPNKIYAATISKDIVVSNDNGIHWTILYTFPTTDFKQINSLKIFNENTLVFTLQDGYSNCDKIYLLDIPTQQIIREYSIPIPSDATESSITSYDFFNSETLIVQQYYGYFGSVKAKVYYSKNGGVNWDTVYHNIDYGSIFPNDVAISPNNANKLFIARQGGLDPEDYGGLFISSDAGQTWNEKLSGIDLGSITFHPENPNDIILGSWYATNTHIYHSIDNGDNWTDVIAGLSESMPNGILEIKYNPSNHNNIIALGPNGILRTNDNFFSYELSTFQNDLENPNNYFFGTYLSFNPFNTNQLLITNNDYPLISNDGGQTVTKINNPYFFSENGHLSLFKSNTAKHLYYSVQNGYSHRDLNTNTENSYNTLPLQVFPYTTNQYYADPYIEGRIYGFYQGDFSSGLSVSNNHGIDVHGIASSNLFLHAITSKPNNPNILYCSQSNDFINGYLYQLDITDFDNIQQTPIELPVPGIVQAFHFDHINSNEMWISINNMLYSTTDNGATWQIHNNGLESISAEATIFNIRQSSINQNQLTIATSVGIYQSTDHGDSWTQLSDFYTHDIAYSNTNNSYVVALTYDSGSSSFALRYSNNAGQNWQQVSPEELHYLSSGLKNSAVDFHGATADVYIGTYSLGVVKFTIDFENLSNPIFNNSSLFWATPNPTSSKAYIKSQENDANYNITIYNNWGQKIATSTKSNIIDLENQPSGIYLVQIESTTTGAIQTSKIVKK